VSDVRVAVIGCGLIGAAVARELQLRGARTVVYEGRAPGRGTSSTTFAWVNSHDKEPRAYHELNVAGMTAHVELQAKRGLGAQWLFATGNLAWADEDDGRARLESICERLDSWQYPLQRLTPTAARALEPDLRLPGTADDVFLFPHEGYVLPHVLLGGLLGDALDAGAELRCPAQVDAVTPTPDGVRLRLADGTSDSADAVVCCAGRWTASVLASAGYALPMVDHETPGSPGVGYLAYTRPAPIRLGRVLTTPRLNVRPDGGGRLVLQALELDGSADPALPAAGDGHIAQEFLARLRQVLRGGESTELEAIRVGQRPIPLDGLTVAGRVDEGGRLYVLVTHSGVTLAPLLARLSADEIVHDSENDILRPFRPHRLIWPEEP
jgi:glycine/D-amino acid oxidase-like deaminating enzyme